MNRLEPATVATQDDGTPYSPRYGDVYHSADSGPGQARHVFLGGNGLPQRWRSRERFVVLETGFGLGINFLATWQAWREDPSRPERLDYVAIDRHPPSREDLAGLLARYPVFADLAATLVDRWPQLLPGMHRRRFGGVVLTLVFDDVERALSRLEAVADAVYLDGFSPARNPEMWSPRVMRAIVRRMQPDATCATWSTARAVRDALAEAGVEVELRPGFGHKREMLAGRLVRPPTRRDPLPFVPERPVDRHAIVVGAGLAGASAAAALATRGWRTTILEASGKPASGASSLHAGAFHPLVARDDSRLARLTRAAFLHALDDWRELGLAGRSIDWRSCGVLQLARNRDDDAALRATIEALAFPASFVRHVDAGEARECCGWNVGRSGVWFPEGGFARAPSVVRALLSCAAAVPGSQFEANARVERLSRGNDVWTAADAHGRVLAAAPVVVLANATDLARLAPLGATLRSVRGQVSYVPAAKATAPRAVVIGHGYALPAMDGRIVVGSSYDLESNEPAPTRDAHEGNLARLRALSPGADFRGDACELEGGVGFRSVAPDRMPVAGAVPCAPALDPRPGLYALGAFASRGLLWSALLGEVLASRVCGDPLPIESDLAEAIDPARFLRRTLRRAGSAADTTAGTCAPR